MNADSYVYVYRVKGKWLGEWTLYSDHDDGNGFGQWFSPLGILTELGWKRGSGKYHQGADFRWEFE